LSSLPNVEAIFITPVPGGIGPLTIAHLLEHVPTEHINDALFDSIAFSAFAVALEEKLEDETGEEFVMDVEKIFKSNPGRDSITVSNFASSIHSLISGPARSSSRTRRAGTSS